MTDQQLRERIIHDIESLQLGMCQKKCSLSARIKQLEEQRLNDINILGFIYNRLLNVHYEEEDHKFMRELKGMLK